MSRPRTRYCTKGHDKWLQPRPDSSCLACQNESRRVLDRERGHIYVGVDRLNRVFLPAAPVLDLLASRDIQISEMGRSMARNIHRAKNTGRISLALADVLCCYLGQHPALVYGNEWWAA